MDLKGSIVNTNVRIYPSPKLINFIASLSIKDNIPENVIQFMEQKNNITKETSKVAKQISVQLNNKDLDRLNKIVEFVEKIESTKSLESRSSSGSDKTDVEKEKDNNDDSKKERKSKDDVEKEKGKNDDSKKERKSNDVTAVEELKNKEDKRSQEPYLLISDLDWLYSQLYKLRIQKKDNIPYIHELLEGSDIRMPENKVMKRNPVLEARCVKLRAQQEAREYRKMTRGVDNVRMKFPEDSIAYQLKQINRQLIAVAQFLLSIFAGFLFGFKGVEWMIGPLDFGFKLLLGVMCSLIIALAEIYFLAKKLNEELSVPETTQLGGPPKFVDESINNYTSKTKEHQD